MREGRAKMSEELINRARFAADQCEAQGFHATAQSLRVLAQQMHECTYAALPETEAQPQHPEALKPLSTAGR